MKVKDFIPLISIISLIILFTAFRQYYSGFSWQGAMLDFMAGFFLVFGTFKLINLTEFAQAYSMYDIVARSIPAYAYLYPFIEIGLGLCYLFRYQLLVANIITLILMIIGSIGVFLALRKKEILMCACMGALFKIPMTYVTLAEDLIMGLMALTMIIMEIR
ncbi:MAG: hypothetical protein AMXMBFR12_04590 [Candidatus Babeliales bacterium]